MMITRYIPLFVIVFSFFTSAGCSTQISAKLINKDLYQASDYYVVVNNPKSNIPGADGEIVSALGSYGISAKVLDRNEAANTHATVIVTYDDWYKWDMAQYLWTLDIYFNNAEMKPFAHANFHHGGFHTFPDRRKMVSRLIEQIMLELNIDNLSKGARQNEVLSGAVSTAEAQGSSAMENPQTIVVSTSSNREIVEDIGISMLCVDSILLKSKSRKGENWLLDCGDEKFLEVQCIEGTCYINSQ